MNANDKTEMQKSKLRKWQTDIESKRTTPTLKPPPATSVIITGLFFFDMGCFVYMPCASDFSRIYIYIYIYIYTHMYIYRYICLYVLV